ncbi:MAG: hypothetical protein N3A58_06400 [Spirochaetes bacterium]|nr:hypothetical protein [Spirochaetota bacterium]
MIEYNKKIIYTFTKPILPSLLIFTILLSSFAIPQTIYAKNINEVFNKINEVSNNFINKIKSKIIKIFYFDKKQKFIKYENQVFFAKLYLETILENSLYEGLNYIDRSSKEKISLYYLEEIESNYKPLILNKYKEYYFSFYSNNNDFSKIYLYLYKPNGNIIKNFIVKNINYEILETNNIFIADSIEKKFFFVNIYSNLNYFDKEVFIYTWAPKLSLLDYILIFSLLLLIIFLIIITQTYYSILLEKKIINVNEKNEILELNKKEFSYINLNDEKNNSINFKKKDTNKSLIEKTNFLNNNYKEDKIESKIKTSEDNLNLIENKNLNEKEFNFDKEIKEIEKEILDL